MADAARASYRTMRSKAGKVYHSFRGSGDVAVFDLNHMTEQEPNPNSRVTLIDECDMLCRRRVRLHWQLSALDIRSIIRAQEIIDEEFRSAGLGKLQIMMRDETPPPHLEGGWHHMGTTRMHRDPKKGVVDEYCRVHGTSNLFIAGPSVFPTCGYANPVLTFVALAVRLADHVKKLMA
jgi:choline dehydrogenase-like flavoprotein